MHPINRRLVLALRVVCRVTPHQADRRLVLALCSVCRVTPHHVWVLVAGEYRVQHADTLATLAYPLLQTDVGTALANTNRGL